MASRESRATRRPWMAEHLHRHFQSQQDRQVQVPVYCRPQALHAGEVPVGLHVVGNVNNLL